MITELSEWLRVTSGLGTELTPSMMLHDRDYFMDRVGDLIALLHKEQGWTLKEGMALLGARWSKCCCWM